MLKNYFKLVLLIGMVYFSPIIGTDVSLNAPDLVEITDQLSENELNLIEHYDRVVYLLPELVQALQLVESKENVIVNDLKNLIQMGCMVAPYEQVLAVVTQAIDQCSQHDMLHASLPALISYKNMMEMGQVDIIKEVGDRKSCKTKKFNKLCITSLVARNIQANCLNGRNGTFENLTVCNVLNVCNINGTTCTDPRCCPLLINSDVTVCGLINGATFPTPPTPPLFTECDSTAPTAFIPSISACGNVTFNTLTVPLDAVGSRQETRMTLVRETIGFTPAALPISASFLGDALTIGNTIILQNLPTPSILSGGGASPALVPLIPVGSINRSFLGSPTITGVVGNVVLRFRVDFLDPFIGFVPPAAEVTYSITNPNNLVIVFDGGEGSAILSIVNIIVSVVSVDNTGMDIKITIVPMGGGFAGSATTIASNLSTLLNNLFAANNFKIHVMVAGIVQGA